MKDVLKILHVETGMNLYGGALQVHYLLRGLADCEDVDSTLVCPRGSAIGEAAKENVKLLHAVPMKGDLDLLFILRLLSILKKENPDIIHLHSRRGADILGGIAARLTGIPCVLTRRVDNPESRLWAGIKYRLYNRIITISDGIREVLIGEGVPPDQIICIHSAVDLVPYSEPSDRSWYLKEFDLEENVLTCGVVAQFIERKGHKYLFEAIPGILTTHSDIRFLLFGRGPLEEDLKAKCRSLGIADRVIFAGFREDLDRILGSLDLLIHPALMEGLGVSLLQAAAAGVPIVGTRVGGIPEIVRDGVNGYLVPPSDVPSLEDAVVRALSDLEKARLMGKNGNKIVLENFSIEAMVAENLSVYMDLLDH